MKKTSLICATLVALITCMVIAFPATFAMQVQADDSSAVTAKAVYSTTDTPSTEDVTEETLLDDVKDVYAEAGETFDPADNEETATTDSAPSAESVTVNEAVESSPSSCNYCGSYDHSNNHCAQRSVDNGAYGRWVVPSVGINVAAYYTGKDPSQAVVDAADSAAYTSYAGVGCLADHSNQGFNTLKNVSVGTTAYMDFGSYRQEYICTEFIYGHNDGKAICDANYNQFKFNRFSSGTIICYTCNGCWQNIIITIFQPV